MDLVHIFVSGGQDWPPNFEKHTDVVICSSQNRGCCHSNRVRGNVPVLCSACIPEALESYAQGNIWGVWLPGVETSMQWLSAVAERIDRYLKPRFVSGLIHPHGRIGGIVSGKLESKTFFMGDWTKTNCRILLQDAP